jgi:hypothetical protein
MKNEIDELVKLIEMEKFKIKVTNNDEIIKIKKSTLCDRLINLLKIMEGKNE